MRESSLWDWLRARLPQAGHYSRIESETSPGFPDIHYSLGGVTGTIELKDSKRPKATCPFGRSTGLRVSQLLWIADELASGGLVLICAGIGSTVHFLPGDLYDSFNQLILTDFLGYSLLTLDRKKSDPLIASQELRKLLMNKR